MSNKEKEGICRVHELVNKDTRIRKVKFCEMCKAWMCRKCWNNPFKRAAAAIIEKMKLK